MLNYDFIALKGRQAGREYYTIMCPLKYVADLFKYQSDEMPPELRAQRTLNSLRIPEIADYIIDNPKNYVFSSITASINGDVVFEPLAESDNSIGHLRFPLGTTILINDGQHRRFAIEEALKESPELGDETLSVVLFVDVGLERSQQMFVDLNKNANKPSTSLCITYDRRDSLSDLARALVENIDVFRNLTDMEKSSISNRSRKLFTISSIHTGTKALLRKKKKDCEVSEQEVLKAMEYWNHVCENMPDWKLAANKNVAASELRQDYVHAHGLAMHVFGKIGAELINHEELDFREVLKGLKNIDWRRCNTAIWEGRAMQGGCIKKSTINVTLTTNKVKQELGLPLTEKEQEAERNYLNNI